MKKTLLAFMLLISVLIMAGCGGAKNPEISDPEGAYLTAKEGSFTYTITNQRMYDVLKKKVGLNMLLDMVDKDLLKAVTKGSTNYWDLVTAADITKEIEQDIFPNGTSDLSETEIAEKRADYYQQLFLNYGLTDEEAINEYYHLEVAKRKYATDQVEAAYPDQASFTDTEYQNYFTVNYKPGYYAIAVSYASALLSQTVLEQLGIKISTDGTWVKKNNNTPLNDAEIVKAFIDMYNSQNAHKLENYPQETLTLEEGTEYTIANGVYTFNLDNIPMLHYTNAQLSSLDSSLPDYLSKDLKAYPDNTWYTKRPLALKGGASHFFIMKIKEETFTLADKKEEIFGKLKEQKLTNTYIQTEMAKLRKVHGIEIYDNDLETSYLNQTKGYKVDYKEIKKTDKNNVAKTDVKTYTADDLFHKMNANYGISTTVEEIDNVRFLINTNLNKIYDYTGTGKKESERILNQSKWDVILADVKTEKEQFNANTFEQYGYPASYGWQNYLESVYGLSTEQELAYYYLYVELRNEYAQSLGDLSEATADSPLWALYQRNMAKAVSDFYSVKGVELLIFVSDKAGVLKNPSDWTDEQVLLAEEFYTQIMDYLKTKTPAEYQTALDDIKNAFLKAPYFLAGIGQNSANQPPITNGSYTFGNIEVSKFKSAGLSVQFKDLGKFENGKEAEFDIAVRSIWAADPDSTTPTVYGMNEAGNYSYLKTETGYHVYVNLESYEIAEWEEGKVAPTLEQIKKYIADSEDDTLTDEIKAAIKKYYDPIHSELVGTTNLYYYLYSAIKSMNLTFTHTDFESSDFIRYLDLKMEGYKENLKYE